MADWTTFAAEIQARVTRFESEVIQVFAGQEDHRSRVITLNQTRRKVAGLSLQQAFLLDQATRCIEFGIYRAAHVMAWGAFVDLLEEKLASDGLAKVHAARPAWSKHGTVDELREAIPEFQLVEVGREVGLYNRTEMKSVLGALARRNECAHPSNANPGVNDSLGYVADLIARMERLANKSL